MGRPRTDYKVKYEEMRGLNEAMKATIEALNRRIGILKEAEDKCDQLLKTNFEMKELLYEQRGIIGYLEDKVKKLEAPNG